MSFIDPDTPLEQIPVVAHIINRIYQVLPIESGLPVYDVEDNVIFLNARKSLITIAQSDRFNDILKYSIIVLNKLNELDGYLLLKQRNINSLSSTLIILRLLADLTKINWDYREPSSRKGSIESAHSSATIFSSVGVGNGSSIDYHTVQPSSLDSRVATIAIQLISRLKSSNSLTQELAFINNKSLHQANLYEDLTTKPFIDQIDANCEAILRFLAAANPQDFYAFTVSKSSVLKHNIGNDTEFAPYLALFASIYLNESLLLEYLKHLRVIVSSIKKSAYRQLVLSFFLKAVTIWVHSRPHEFLNVAKVGSEVSIEADALFDEILSFSDGPKASGQQHRMSYKFLAFLFTLNPKTLEHYLYTESKSKSNTLKKIANFHHPNNKKLKILTNIIKVLEQQQVKDSSDNTAVLESIEFLVLLACIAGSIHKLDPDHIVLKFSLKHFDTASRALVPISSSRPSPLLASPTTIETQLLAELRLTYYSNICALDSDNFVPLLVKVLNEETSTLETLNITTSVLRVYTSAPSFDFNNNQSLIVSILPSLRRTMIKMASLVKNSSTVSSIYDEDESESIDRLHSASTDHSQYRQSDIQNKATESLRSPSTTTSQSSSNTPKSEKFKESTKNLFRHHHSGSFTTSVQTSGQHQLQSSDDIRSIDSRDASVRSAIFSREILANALGIFKKFPHLYLASFSESNAIDKVAWLYNNAPDLLEPLITALNDSGFKLNQAAYGFIYAAFSISNIPDDLDICTSVFAGSGVIALVFAKTLLETYSSDSRKEVSLEYFVRILESRVAFHSLLSQHTHFKEIKEAEAPYHWRIATQIEELLVFSLCRSNPETYSLIKRGIKAYEKELSLKTQEDQESDYNVDFLLSIANDTSFTTGLVALQKNIRKKFFKITTATPAICNVWNRIYNKWYTFAANSDYSELSQAELLDFRNFAGFIASTSGTFVDIGANPALKQEFSPKIETFISQQLNMLREDSLVTRENAKEILSSELNPKSYPILVRLLKPRIAELEEKKTLTEQDIVAAEHKIVLLKAVLAKSEVLPLFSVSVDVIRSTEALARIVETLPKNTNGLKLRVRLSVLFHDLELHGDDLVIRSAFKDRNRFLRCVFNWFDQAVAYHSEQDDNLRRIESSINEAGKKDLEYLYIDLALESAKALSLILDSLILESPQALNEEELKFSKARIFNIYFTSLLKALERFSDATKFPVSMKHKLTQITDYIVLCLTNLLKANVEVGFPFALEVGYHPNMKIRLSFLNVFVAIVQSYTESTPMTEEIKRRAVAKLFNLLLHRPSVLSAIGRVCPAADAPALASFALSLANRFNQSAIIVSYLVEEEIIRASSYTDILRRNSFASRSLSAFGRIKGTEYLVSTLKPILTEIRDSEAELEVEKIDIDDPEAQQNLNNFMHYLKKLINVIINSYEKAPIEFKKVCNTISKSVENKFPNYRLIAVGSFVFLRFFCPAIVSPESENIVDIPNRQTQRKFLLLAKVLQNMANGSIGTLRWPILKSREAELTELNDKLTKFLDSVSVLDDSVKFELTAIDVVEPSEFNFFHTYAYDNWSTIRSEHLRTVDTPEGYASGRALSEQINWFLSIAGQPSMSFGFEIPQSVTPETNSQLYDFMCKYSSKNLGSLSDNAFIRQDITRNGTHLFVFTYRDYIKIKDIDEELALYRMFQVVSKIWDHKFNFVFDCSGADGADMFPRKALRLFGKLAPEQMHENCSGIYYYNVSSTFFPELLESFKRQELFSTAPHITYTFLSGLDDPKTIMNLGLSKASVNCYNDVRVKFTDVSMYQTEQGRFVPILMKIGNENLQICQTTPQRVKLGNEVKEIFLDDVFRLKDVLSVQATETTTVPNEITIFLKNGREIVLTSPKYLEIMRLLYFSTNRISHSPPDKLFESGKPVNRILGKIFNVVFMSLTSSSPMIRSVAYNLLVACAKFWNFDVGKDLTMFEEAYFPRDNNTFVMSISEKLAQQKPEVTTEFISAFFKTYNDSVTARQRLSAIMYISPWIGNIYEHVFTAEEENGSDYVSEIIRNFLKITDIDPLFLSLFNVNVWSKLCLEDGISSILVNEIVLAAIDCEAEGSDWSNVIALLTSHPTMEVCSVVIRRLRDLSRLPFPDENGVYSVASHSNWVEISVLVQICVSFFFDNVLFAEMFLPDVFHIVTILIDIGPLGLRIASHQLLLNVLQSFYSKKTISEESKNVLRSTVASFTTARTKLLFGLNRDTADDFSSEISRFGSRINTLESFVDSLSEVIEAISANDQEKSVWIVRWNRYVLEAAGRKDSVLRGRALFLLGVLSKRAVNDHMVTKVLEMIAEDIPNEIKDPRVVYLTTCTLFALGRISEGLLPESVYFSRMFWIITAYSRSVHITVYHPALQALTKIVETMNRQEKFPNCDVVEGLFADRHILAPLLEQLEALDGIIVDKRNIDQFLAGYAAKGLQLQHTKPHSIEALKVFFKVRFCNETVRVQIVPDATFDDSVYIYLLFLFVLLKPDELRGVLNDADLEDGYIVLDDQTHLPRSLANHLLSGDENSRLALIQAANYFNNGEPNNKSSYRFLQLLKFIGERNPVLLLNTYCEIRATLRKIVGTSSLSTTLVTSMFAVASLAYTTDGYDRLEEFSSDNDELLKKYNIPGIRSLKFPPKEQLATAEPKYPTVNGELIFKPLFRRSFQTRFETEK